eukprot:scaffold19250_cov58-Phaeocystis_antarctica.AAC.3
MPLLKEPDEARAEAALGLSWYGRGLLYPAAPIASPSQPLARHPPRAGDRRGGGQSDRPDRLGPLPAAGRGRAHGGARAQARRQGGGPREAQHEAAPPHEPAPPLLRRRRHLRRAGARPQGGGGRRQGGRAAAGL